MSLDPRVARSRAAVLAATVDLLAERGWSGTTVEAVAERAGVAKTTIYRHWSGREALVLDACAALSATEPFTPTEDLYADLVTLLCTLADTLETAPWARVLPALVEAAERESDLAALAPAVAESHRAAVVDRVRRAVTDGHLDGEVDVEVMAHMLADPLFYRRLCERQRTPTRFIEGLVDQALRAAGR